MNYHEPIIVRGEGLTLKEVAQVATANAKIQITHDESILKKVQASCDYIQNAVKIGEPIYGVTSGFGGMAHVVIPAEQAAELQNNMPWFHKVGAGKLLPVPEVRASMLLRANSLLRGVSGVRLELIWRLERFLNAGVTPHIYDLGSIGASGDLTPLAYLAATLVGLDKSFRVDFNGETLDALTALERLNLPRLQLLPKESLAIMNGTSVMAGIAALCVDRAWTLFALALGAHAIFLQSLSATNQTFHPFIHQHKPHPGQVWTAAHMLDLITGSQFIRDDMYGRNNYRGTDLIQDRYSLRCLPQYLGPIVEGLQQITRQLEVEINSATDNPLIDVKAHASYHCGNFLGQYVGVTMDQLRYHLSLLAKHLDTQIALLVAPEFNHGLPSSLVGNPKRPVNMGLKGLQITGNSIMPLITFLGNSLADRYPTHAEQFNQNINSQGFGSANLARQSIELFHQYIAVNLLFAIQAADLKTHQLANHYDARTHLSPLSVKLYTAIKTVVGKPPTPEKPYIWNDNEQTLDEHIQRIVADITANGLIPQAVSDTLHSLTSFTPYSTVASSPPSTPSVAPMDWEDYTKLNVAQCIENHSITTPKQIALIFEDTTYTYAELNEAVNRLANGLQQLDVKKGERVALLLPNIPAFVIAYHSCQKIGAIVVSINTFLKAAETTFILNDCQAQVLITTAELRANINKTELSYLKHVLIAEGDAPEAISLLTLMTNASPALDAIPLDRNTPAAIVYTSGTTGFPKGATLSQGNVISNILAKKHYLQIQPADKLLLFLPLFHCFGQNAVLNCGLEAGATIVLQRQFDPNWVEQALHEHAITMFFGVPTTFTVMYDRLTREKTKKIRYYFSAAASLSVELARDWQEKFGAFVYQGYGLSETSPFASYNHLTKPKLGSVGTPIQHVDMRIVDIDNGRPLAVGEIGEIAIRGPNVMLGYWNRPTETAAVLKEGWFYSGDLGRMDYEGYFYLVDRLKDMINVGGLKAYPAEIEKVLSEHPAVAEVAAYGIPDPLMGEQVKASVVLKPNQTVTAEELTAFALKRLANFKIPGLIEFTDKIPKSPTGKILRRILREQAAQAPKPQTAPTTVQSAETIQNWITTWMSQQLSVAPIDAAKPFADYGMNSLMNVKLTRELGDWLGQTLEVVLAWRHPTPQTMAQHLAELLKPEQTASAAGICLRSHVPWQQRPEHPDQVELWPSVAEFFVYDEFLYTALTTDERRNQSYKVAINRQVKDKIVVEIGTGKDAILSRFCAHAGATKIYAIERNPQTCQLAKEAVAQAGYSAQIEIIHGDATEVQLPELADVCVSEIVGSIGGSEGSAVIINNARRLLKPNGKMLPERSTTKIAAVTFPDELWNDLGFTRVSGHYTQKIFEQIGYPFDVRLCVKNFPKSHVLTDFGIFEDLDYTQPLATNYQHENYLTIQRDGRFDGFLVWLTLETIAGEIIDILEHEHSWLPIYFPAFTPGISVHCGDTLTLTCGRSLCENQLNPDYQIYGTLQRKSGENLKLRHDSYHHQRHFGHDPFYAKLFRQTVKTSDTASLSEQELANLLAQELNRN